MAGKLKSIAVYCGHQMGDDPQFKRDARAVGRMLAKTEFVWSLAVVTLV